ncbi:MAG: GNAT family N-acetyltransferase [Pseudomonadota bacterium]
MTDHVIHRAGPEKARLVGQITGEAFADDPISLWILQNPKLITRLMTRLATHVYVPDGFAEYLDNEQGATMWMPPGGHGELAGFQKLAALFDMMVCGVPSALGRSAAFGSVMQRVTPKEPHFYLFTIGVLPGGQGKGLGGALLRSGLAQADRASMPTYLESSKADNIPIYQRYGFELRDVPADLPEGCPPIYPMWRPVKGRPA